MGYHNDGSIWFSSECKAIKTDCARFEAFPPGSYYSSKTKSIQRYYTPGWWDESIPKGMLLVFIVCYVGLERNLLLKLIFPLSFSFYFHIAPASPTPSTEESLTRLREAFEASVVRRMMCDVPYGVLLSGGLDSSLVASIVSRHAERRTEDQERTKGMDCKEKD
jgi:asparagine synthase (glutamine-hydrolysing)